MSPALTAQNISERLKSCMSWESKSRLLIQLSREIPAFADADRCEANHVSGCESQVWLKLAWHDGMLDLAIDSDSRVIKGLLALVYAAYQGRSAQDVRDFDFDAWLAGMGLTRLLTASRGNGLKAVVTRLRLAAA